jgi:carbamoyl-phosphate synthase small subunit
MTRLLIRGARILGGEGADLLVEDGVIRDVGSLGSAAAPGGEVIDADGLVALPGLVDLHVHLREPGREDAETIATGSAAAAAGGFTAVFAMANTDPVTDTAEAAERVHDLGRACGLVDVVPVGAVTKRLEGSELAELGLMARSRARVRVFSDDGRCVHDARLMRRALEYIKPFGGVISQHSQDPRLADSSACCHEGELSGRLGLPGWPGVAEESIVARDVMLAHHTGSRVHVAHVSTAGTVEVIRWAKARGIDVTAEVTPHHLALTTDLLVGYDPVYKVNPPLRPQEDVDALRNALADGTIDVVATDHAPHARHDKEHAFVDAAFGMLGLETALAVVSEVLVRPGLLDWAAVARVHDTGPDRRPQRPGSTAAARSAGQHHPRRPGAGGHRRRERQSQPLAQQPLARAHLPRRRPHDHPPRNGHPQQPADSDGERIVTLHPPSRTGLVALVRQRALLVLEDGRIFRGLSYGALGETLGEAVFSTGMTGYQETLTDPSYHRQVIVMTAPHVGNTGVNDEDGESRRIWAAGYVVRDPALRSSSWRATRDLEDELRDQGVVGICEIDTRALTRHLREGGSMRVGIFSGDAAGRPEGELLDVVLRAPLMAGSALAEEVSTTDPYVVPATGEKRFTVAALDLGIKEMTPQMMAERGIEVHVLPATSTVEQVMAVGGTHGPDGVFFSNGPGDPATAEREIGLLRQVLEERVPFFGICFGNQLLGRALGFGTYKLKYGHRGINQPVMDRATGKVEVTAHNHGFAVDAPLDEVSDTPFGRARVSHVCLNDDVVEGLECLDVPAYSVQYHPEAAAGPHDAAYLFDRFVELMTARETLQQTQGADA